MAHATQSPEDLQISRRLKNRRVRADRRAAEQPEFSGPERRDSSRRKVERRRMIDPTTCERDYSELEVEFMRAMDDYKRRSGRMFPTWSEVLEVIHDLGYRKIAVPMQSYTEGGTPVPPPMVAAV